MKISTQLSIATIVILISAILGTGFVVKTSHSFDRLNFESQTHDEIVLAITDFRAASRQIIVETYQSLYLSKGKDRFNFNTAAVTAKERLFKLLDLKSSYELNHHVDSGLKLDILTKNLDELLANLTNVLDLEIKGHSQKSKSEMQDLIESNFKKNYLNEISNVLDVAYKKNQDIQRQMGIEAQRLAYITPLGLIIVFLLSAAIFIPLTFSLKRKVSGLMGYLNEFDFENNRFPSIPQDGKDEFSHIGWRFNQLFTNLKLSKSQIDKQQRDLMISSRMASLGEMSAGVGIFLDC